MMFSLILSTISSKIISCFSFKFSLKLSVSVTLYQCLWDFNLQKVNIEVRTERMKVMIRDQS
jgi:hypothetical protein